MWVHCVIERVVKVDPLVNTVIENKRKGVIDPLCLELALDLVEGTFMQRLKSFYFHFHPFSCL